jgi:myo-inositol-1(or 4)-monophosphatase
MNTHHNVTLHPLLMAATRAARKGAAILTKASLDIHHITTSRKQDGSIVTEVDRMVQQEILYILKDNYPNHNFIAEESHVQSIDPKKEYTWYIDPLDGTSNFMHGFDHYAISIAVVKNNNIEHSVIYNPINDELFTASKGRGAFLNNKRLRVSTCMKISEALVASSFMHKKNLNSPTEMQKYINVASSVSGMRRTGSIALDLAYVAAGRLDAFFDSNLYTWDIAAGLLMVKEAGGLLGDFNGDVDHDLGLLNGNSLLVSTPKIFPSLISCLGK